MTVHGVAQSSRVVAWTMGTERDYSHLSNRRYPICCRRRTHSGTCSHRSVSFENTGETSDGDGEQPAAEGEPKRGPGGPAVGDEGVPLEVMVCLRGSKGLSS
jgi:hypothetical protein